MKSIVFTASSATFEADRLNELRELLLIGTLDGDHFPVLVVRDGTGILLLLHLLVDQVHDGFSECVDHLLMEHALLQFALVKYVLLVLVHLLPQRLDFLI